MKKPFLLLAACISITAFSQQYELPAQSSREQKVAHTLFTLSYAEGYELASWAAWQLTPEMAKATGTFKEKFEADPAVATGSSSPKDYRDAGFIEGQLVPVEDLLINPAAAQETFLMSNVVPMKPAFNKFVWKATEKLVRAWATEGNTLYVVAGPVLADAPFGSFGSNKVSIPTRFYQAVLDVNGKRAIGFLYRSTIASGTPKSFAISIDELEKITGIDFFPSLPDDLEEAVESSKDFGKWNFKTLEQ
jgi:endonuclease G, mitochondrial